MLHSPARVPAPMHEETLGAHVVDDMAVAETGAGIPSSSTRHLVLIEPRFGSRGAP